MSSEHARAVHEPIRVCAPHDAVEAVVAIVLGFLATSALAAGAPPANIGVDEYKQLVVKQRAAIQSMRISYQTALTYDSALVEPGLIKGITLNSKATVAFKGAKCYSQFSSNGISVEGRPSKENATSVFTGTENRCREGSTLQIRPERSSLSELDAYRNAMLWPVSGSDLTWCQSNPTETYFLPYFLDAATWQVLPDRQKRGKVACIVMKKTDGSRELWLDPARGHCLIYYRQDRPWDGTLRCTTDYEDHREVLPGVYWPRRIVSTHERSDPRTGKFLGKTQNVLELLGLEINNVPDSLFTLNPRPGEWVTDSVRRVSHRYYPSNDATLIDVVEEARREYGARTTPRASTPYLVAGNLAILMVIASHFCGRWWRARRERLER